MHSPTMYSVLSIAFIILLNSHNTLAAEFSYTIEVSPRRINCFFQPVTDAKYVSFEIDYQVIDGGDMNINFLLSNPQGTMLIQDLKRTDNSHKIDVTQTKGDYQFCFDNTFSYQSEKVVFFQMFLFDAAGNTEELDFGKLSSMSNKLAEIGMTVDEFAVTMTRIRTNLNKAEHFQSLLRAYEARDRAIMEANFDRVNNWSIVNLFIMVFVAAVQVYMIRSLFEDSSKLGKILRHSR